MLLRASLITCIIGLAGTVRAVEPQDMPNKPPLVPKLGFFDGTFDAAYTRYLPNITWTSSHWSSGQMPANCRTGANAESISPWQFDVLNVTFSDCAQPWVVCRHKNAPFSEQKIFDLLGRIPVRTRQFLSEFVAVAGGGGDAGTDRSWATYRGPFDIGQMLHEFGHTLDLIAPPLAALSPSPYNEAFSFSTYWRSRVQLDTAFITDADSYVEGFAELARAAVFDIIYPGGIAAVNPNASHISHQLSTYEFLLGDILQPTGRCNSDKVPASPTVYF